MAEETQQSRIANLSPLEFPSFNASNMGGGVVGVGGITPEDLPEQWGGRPTGTSRRAIRMQKEWDDRRSRQIQEYNIQRDAYENDRSFGLQMRDQAIQEADFQMRQEERVANQKIEFETKTQGANITKAVSNLNPRSPTFQDDVAKVVAENPLGVTLPSVAALLERYDAVNKIEAESAKSIASASKEESNALADAIEAGVSQDEIEAAKIGINGREGYDIGKLKKITAGSKYKASEEERGFKRSEKEDRLRQAAVDAEARAESLKEQFGEDNPIYAEQAARASGARARYEDAIKGSEVKTPTRTARGATPEQIETAKRIASDPNNPKNTAAKNFLRALGQ